ncbi:MAG: hypothetical protein JW722_07845 [Demequinaceae bacterium]|nr:hypothetical protein [Demequinaceae bacterium]
MRIAFGIFIIGHAFIHLMFVGQALRWFENRPGSRWPDGAALFPSSIPDGMIRAFAAASIGLTGIAMVVGGVGVILQADWSTRVVIGSAVLVSIAHAAFWNGDWKTSPDQGLYGVIINVAVIVAMLVVRA